MRIGAVLLGGIDVLVEGDLVTGVMLVLEGILEVAVGRFTAGFTAGWPGKGFVLVTLPGGSVREPGEPERAEGKRL